MPNKPMPVHPDWLRPDWNLPHVHAFMTTRAGGVSDGAHASMNVGRSVQDAPERVAANRALVSAALQADAVFMPQVHGVEVLRLQPEYAQADAQVPAADASISTTRGLGCAIQVADCLPVLFAAPAGVGGAHAGWRGLSGGVLENTVQALCEASCCEPREMHAWMGACIGAHAFEVGADVLEAFGVDPRNADQRFFAYRPNAAGQARWRADLVGLARSRLEALGLASVSGGHWCTYSEDSRFFSYRRARLSGRMVAAISLR
jgi:hypothetical protein